MKNIFKNIILPLNITLILAVILGDICYITLGGLAIKATTSIFFVLLGLVNLIYIILKKEYHDNLAFVSVLTSLLLQSLNPKTKTELHFEPSKDDKQYLRIYKKTRRK